MKLSRLIALALGTVLLSNVASAQLQNRPFAFKNSPTGGVGMSVGGQQAILNQQLTGAQPDVLVRAPSGELLDVRRGNNGLAVVSVPGGNVIPGFRGSGFRAGTVGMQVGAFNAFFVPQRRNAVIAPPPMQATSAETVTLWTARVVTSSSVQGRRYNPVDIWTGYVFSLPVAN